MIFCCASSAGACILRKQIDPVVPVLMVPKAKPSSWEHENYFLGLLRLVLERTAAEYGPCNVEQTRQVLTRMRGAALIARKQNLDLLWSATTLEQENLLRPIRIPLLRGLMKHKVLLIHAAHQPQFSNIKTLEQLQQLRAGMGADWPDTTILLTNGINVVSSTNYESLYKMLAADRFDFFPRGAHQALSEARYHKDKQVVVERDLVLVYPSPVYFFVEKNNHRLARRIEKGMRAIIDDGSFDTYFANHPLIVEVLNELRLNERHPIYMQNPLLPAGAALETDEDWVMQSLETWAAEHQQLRNHPGSGNISEAIPLLKGNN